MVFTSQVPAIMANKMNGISILCKNNLARKGNMNDSNTYDITQKLCFAKTFCC